MDRFEPRPEVKSQPQKSHLEVPKDYYNPDKLAEVRNTYTVSGDLMIMCYGDTLMVRYPSANFVKSVKDLGGG